jgi:hypothetical protein
MENYLRIDAGLRLVIMRSESLRGLIELAPATHRARVAEFEPRLNAFFMKHVVASCVKGYVDCFEADGAP